jgi:acyl-coenzyme A synthetase/AMP-(fatty) acid ligase
VAAYRAGVPLPAGQLLAQAAALAESLPPGAHLLNLACDRVRFAVAFLAGVMAHRVSLLPSSHTPELVRRLYKEDSDALCVCDSFDMSLPLRQVRIPGDSAAAGAWPPPTIPSGQVCAQLYTSGSTGAPTPHRKTFGRLVRGVCATARQLGLTDGRRHALVATVPPQHMYGLEASVLLPLASGHALTAEQPFYPADVCETLAGVPTPRVLVSTPMHLRALLAAGNELPPTELIISATAPLTQEEARAVEGRFSTKLVEIYGSTETGQLALRRTALTDAWRLYPQVQLWEEHGRTWAAGGHVEQAVPLNDQVELLPGGRFLLHGRLHDLVNIAGKRSSLAYLDHQLRSIPGVTDGAFFHLEENAPSRTGVTRVAAVVAAPGLSTAAVLAALRARLDPVFLPRPLLLVERLPRNATGKLPLAELRGLAALRAAGGLVPVYDAAP